MRLIDADKLIELCNTMADKRDGIGKSIWEQFAATVEWSPTVDAVPVVRCKDCKYSFMTYQGECKYCDVWEEEGEMYLDGDFYCGFGKRREDEINATQNSVGNALDEVTEDAEIN